MFHLCTYDVYKCIYSALLQVNIFSRNFSFQGAPSPSTQRNDGLNIHLAVEWKQHTNKTKALRDRSQRYPAIVTAGRAVAQWLRHYATNRQVAGPIPDYVIGIFQ
jgi:hypothetical protein